MVLVLTGGAITLIQVGNIKALFVTDYGARLLIKLGLFAVLLAVAGYNKFSLTPAVLRGGSASRLRLRQTIKTEYMVFVLILAAAASLTMIPLPSRSPITQPKSDAIFRSTVNSAQIEAEVEVTPAKPGSNMFMITFKDKSGSPVKLSAVKMTLAQPEADIGGIEKDGEPVGISTWHFMADETTVPGDWRVKFEAFTDPFNKTDIELTVPIN